MKIAIVANEQQKKELLESGINEGLELVWTDHPENITGVDAYMDLQFRDTPEETEQWAKWHPALLIVNAVNTTLQQLPPNTVRINGWPGFLKRTLIEASCEQDQLRVNSQKLFFYFNKEVEWVADVPGFITPRVISMIINEAYYALAEEVSTKAEIDIAMKLGTNYPYGPFEWSELIGLHNVYQLLNILAQKNSRYSPAPSLIIEVNH